ncbi:MAG TPA: hypothetical protein EYO51_00440 [Methylococcaceae bacterium]|jgi:hypothetical protein|nr:hypothetical protein [Methylococcaceae bacterium]HIB61633.1 hypothetical protein [Methylococcaceae bacterium]
MVLLRPFTIIGRCFRGMIVFLLFLNTANAGESQGQQDFSVVGGPVPLVDVTPEQGSLKRPVKHPRQTTFYGLWIGTEGQLHTSDFIDQDGDLVDDRWQAGPGKPEQR